MVDSINKLGDKIYTLNKKISKIESTGIEDANDLRDERDAAIDELSKYIDITYYENDSKEVIISAEGIPFVTMGELAKMDTRVVEGTNLHGRDMKEMCMIPALRHLMWMIQTRVNLKDFLLQEAIWLLIILLFLKRQAVRIMI